MTKELTETVAAWVTEVAMRAAQLPSTEGRAGFFADRRREFMQLARDGGMSEDEARVLTESCVEGAERIMQTLLARGTSTKGGSA